MKYKKAEKRKTRIGLALGGGSARGLTHIGVLKVLRQHNLSPDYIAGTSIGAVIGALYAAGHSPEGIAELARTTDWKTIVDFTVPKSGLIKGYQIEKKLKKLTYNKSFAELNLPLRVVAVDLKKGEKVIFSRGNVARAVHTSLAIPGIFTPVKIDSHYYVDGGLLDPTPFDVVKEMGADLIIAVDLFQKLKTSRGPELCSSSLFEEFKKKFIAEELLNLKHYLAPKRFPEFVIRMFEKLFDQLLYPGKILKILAKRKHPPIFRTIYQSNNILINALAKERLKSPDIDVLITPSFSRLTWTDFNQVDQFIKLGEKATLEKIPQIKRKLRDKN